MIINPYIHKPRTLALLNGNGTNGSTVFADSSVYANTFTAFGTAQISTAQSKFGGASMLFSGATGSYISAPYINDYAIAAGQDFTIEAWVYSNNTSDGTYACVIDPTVASSAYIAWAFQQQEGNYRLAIQDPGAVSVLGGAIITGQWVHVAACRKAGVITFYRNGVGGTPVNNNNRIYAVTPPTSSLRLRLGNLFNSVPRAFNGYIDDFRYSRIARYDGNFTPPATEATI